VLEGLEKEARDAKKGLWADPQPVLSWEWRLAGRWSRLLRNDAEYAARVGDVYEAIRAKH